ncbi:hypothetical protein VFA_003319 [Vibrio furnissii CIP 102972]|nr:hypothetical protein VFA_003319 [Vibrio furnissii CIP 102972]
MVPEPRHDVIHNGDTFLLFVKKLRQAYEVNMTILDNL